VRGFRLLILFLLLARPVLADAGPAEAFARYLAALQARDGAAAAVLVTAGSLAREETLRDLALTAPPDAVAALPMVDRLAVLRLRHEFTADELRPLSGADLMGLAVAEEWTSPEPLAVLTVTGAALDGDAATLQVARAGESVPVRLVLRRERGAWKLDLVEQARGSDAALAETLAFRATRAKVPLDQVLRWAIEDRSGHLVDKDLTQPLAAD
jgi:hypothetical protein